MINYGSSYILCWFVIVIRVVLLIASHKEFPCDWDSVLSQSIVIIDVDLSLIGAMVDIDLLLVEIIGGFSSMVNSIPPLGLEDETKDDEECTEYCNQGEFLPSCISLCLSICLSL